MSLSLDSKVKEIMASPQGRAVLEKWVPGATKDPRIRLVGGMTCRQLLRHGKAAPLVPYAAQIEADLRACEK